MECLFCSVFFFRTSCRVWNSCFVDVELLLLNLGSVAGFPSILLCSSYPTKYLDNETRYGRSKELFNHFEDLVVLS